ncbi:sugar phosphate isomerase/epimerase [candidate division NPL-UPA2 bacterium]|nr:sugar phosphate isomerase/epimerase [candidate division NPL-UPA2 bacterium]
MRLAISSMSFRRVLESGLDIIEFINLAKERYNIDNVEISSRHIKSLLPVYLESIEKTLKSKEVELINILCETAHMYDPDQEQIEPNTNMIRRWMRICQKIGCQAIRIHSGAAIVEEEIKKLERIHAALGAEEEETEDTSVEKTIMGVAGGYRRVAFTAQTFGVFLLLENHQGFYGETDNILRILREVDSPMLKLAPNTDGFTAEEIPELTLKKRDEGLKLLCPHAYLIRLKTYDFDINGQEKTFDLNHCLQVIKETGFDGILCLEYAGEGDEHIGVEKSVALLR